MAKPPAKKPAKRKPQPNRAPTSPNFRPPLGNQYWKLRTRHGLRPKYETGEALWDACVEYFEWVVANPLKEEKVFCNQGIVTHTEVSKMRAMTQKGLCLYLGISAEAWNQWGKREELAATVADVNAVIYDYKFAGAAAELLSPVLIARELGLKDGVDHNHSGEIRSITRTIVDPAA